MISFDHVTLGQRVLFGAGAAADNTALAVSSLGAQRILLISDAFAVEIADAISALVNVVDRIDEVVQHVPVANARAAVARAKASRADAVVAIGGGSATGLAKIVARDTGLPIVAVPTTFAGSEATNVWGLTEADRKTTGIDDGVLPKFIVYDASLMAALPARLAITSGLNAVAHAIDGFWAPRADPINAALASEGLRILVPGLRSVHADAHDLTAREQCLYGAYLAAVAFASAGSGMHHKICHALGGTFGLPHAETHAVVIGYVTEYNAPFAPHAARRLQDVLGSAASPAAAVASLGRELGAPRSLRDIGFQQRAIPEAAGIILPSIPATNPRPVTQESLESLLHAAWAGEPVE